MKKIGIFMMLLLSLAVVSCGSKESTEKVAQKIASGQTLDRSDYTTIIKYLGDFAEKAQPIQDKINNADSATPALDSEMAKLHSQYSLTGVFNTALENSNAEAVGEENVKLLEKYAPLEWFTAPSWLTAYPDAGVAGEIVETPPAGDSNGVVAGAVDDVKVEKL
ncbi:MAG: hypothetical protein K2N03_01140 [Muribaculaceae bacterium]|nr:hypothetical protein [Muribaculaceae bacterium]